MSLARILSSEPLPLHPTELRDGVYSKAAIDKYIRDLHNYLRRLFGFFTAGNLVTEINNGDGSDSFAQTQWRAAYVGAGTATTLPNLTPTSTKPSGINVYTPEGTRVLIAALSDVAGQASMRVAGWRRLSGVWYPENIMTLAPSADSGLVPDGTQLDAALLLPQTHTSINGNTENFVFTGAAGLNAFGYVATTHNGVELVQVDVRRTGAATKVNGIVAFA